MHECIDNYDCTIFYEVWDIRILRVYDFIGDPFFIWRHSPSWESEVDVMGFVNSIVTSASGDGFTSPSSSPERSSPAPTVSSPSTSTTSSSNSSSSACANNLLFPKKKKKKFISVCWKSVQYSYSVPIWIFGAYGLDYSNKNKKNLFEISRIQNWKNFWIIYFPRERRHQKDIVLNWID